MSRRRVSAVAILKGTLENFCVAWWSLAPTNRVQFCLSGYTERSLVGVQHELWEFIFWVEREGKGGSWSGQTLCTFLCTRSIPWKKPRSCFDKDKNNDIGTRTHKWFHSNGVGTSTMTFWQYLEPPPKKFPDTANKMESVELPLQGTLELNSELSQNCW